MGINLQGLPNLQGSVWAKFEVKVRFRRNSRKILFKNHTVSQIFWVELGRAVGKKPKNLPQALLFTFFQVIRELEFARNQKALLSSSLYIFSSHTGAMVGKKPKSLPQVFLFTLFQVIRELEFAQNPKACLQVFFVHFSKSYGSYGWQETHKLASTLLFTSFQVMRELEFGIDVRQIASIDSFLGVSLSSSC